MAAPRKLWILLTLASTSWLPTSSGVANAQLPDEAYRVARQELVAELSALPGTAPEARAQEPAGRTTARITGSVTGTVFFADTQRPARFANVQLVSVASVTGGGGGGFRGGGGGAGARTSLDGTFLIENVEVGDYFVAANATGYISPLTELQTLVANGMSEEDATRKLTVVHVAQGAASNTSLTLERGAVIAGTAAWDDGSPAAGVQISTVSSTTQTSTTRGFGGNPGFGGPGRGGEGATTDDRGRFRVMGIAPGEYYVRASVQAPAGSSNGGGGRGGFARTVSLTVYAPGKLRRSEAETLKLASAEERDGITVVLNLRALHTVSGRISSAGGGAVSGGQVRIVDSTDSSLSRSGEVGNDGSFSVPYVPAGTYTLTVNARTGGGGTQGQGGAGFDRGQSLQPLQQTLAVTDGDVSGLALTVTPATTASAQ